MEIIIALIILIFVSKYIVFNVKINAIVFGVSVILVFCLKPTWLPHSNIVMLLLGINIIDCIRDVVVSDQYYEPMSEKIDRLYALKSVSSICLILLGWFYFEKNLVLGLIPRAVFLILVYPIQYLTVAIDVIMKLRKGLPIPYYYQLYSRSKKKRYWYKRIVDFLAKNDKIISNRDVVLAEFNISRDKFSKNYPEKISQQLILSIFDKDKKAELEKMKSKLKDISAYKHMAYISTDSYSNFKQKIYQVLITKNAAFSPCIMKKFAEFENMNLGYSNGIYKDTEWSEYFIIKVLSYYVKSGELNDYACSDEPLDNHSYGVKIKSYNASDNPLLALDDD